MVTFFTMMVITFSLDTEEAQMRLLYTSETACSDAMQTIETVVDPALHIEMLQCQRSEMMSRSPRPKSRPWEG